MMYKAIGIIELKCIPKGVEAADAALKSAGVEMVSSHPSCPGKYEIILTGSISNVTAAVSHVCSKFEGFVIDSSVIGRIAITNTRTPMPPTQWVKLRQNSALRLSGSTAVRIEAPVVVKPDTVSKNASI